MSKHFEVEMEKSWWASKTVWGAIITVASVCAGFFGFELSADEQAALTDSVVGVVGSLGVLVGAGVSVYGRFKAETKLKK
jgi:uncharacterized membrane protein